MSIVDNLQLRFLPPDFPLPASWRAKLWLLDQPIETLRADRRTNRASLDELLGVVVDTRVAYCTLARLLAKQGLNIPEDYLRRDGAKAFKDGVAKCLTKVVFYLDVLFDLSRSIFRKMAELLRAV